MRTARLQQARHYLARVLLGCTLLAIVATAAACPYAGHYLIIDEPLEPADAILVLGGTRAIGWREAVDLYGEHMAPNIVLSPGIVEHAEVELRAKGIRFPSNADLVTDAMVQLGIPAQAITVLPADSVDNTADEASVTRTLAIARGWRRLIVVTSKYHTRRTRYAFEREFTGRSIEIRVRGSRHDEASPDGWWRSRSDLRYVTSELQKLIAYHLGLGR